jgi:Flp pilus assembly pilin Flp
LGAVFVSAPETLCFGIFRVSFKMNDTCLNRAILPVLTSTKGKGPSRFREIRQPVSPTKELKEMNIRAMFSRFRADETGAVTVDWVVLTAGVCSLVVIAMAGLKGNMSSIGQRIEDHLMTATIDTTF